MKFGYKKLFSVCIIVFLLISLVYPFYQVESAQETTGNILSCSNLLYLERVCFEKELGFSGESVARHMLQSLRRQNSKVIPMGFQIETKDEMRFIKIANDVFVGFVFMTVLMTIIIYIFRTDGKKRLFCK